MTTETLDLADAIYQEAQQLPLESLLDLAKFVEFLRFKAKQEQAQETSDLGIVKLRGILKDYDVSPEALAAARREMWRKLDSSPS